MRFEYLWLVSVIRACYIRWKYQQFWLSVGFWQIKSLVVFWCAHRFFTIRKVNQRNCIKLIIGFWFQCHSHTPIIRHQLQSFLSKSGRSLNVINIFWAMSVVMPQVNGVHIPTKLLQVRDRSWSAQGLHSKSPTKLCWKTIQKAWETRLYLDISG